MDFAHSKIIADEIISLFINKGNENYSGEAITQLEHAFQAAQFAKEEGYNDDVILAAFLHDIGHLIYDDSMNGFGVKDHETIGSDYLAARSFSNIIVILVKSHVEAKRYLCFTNKEYYNQLSDASKTTLAFQGGIMSNDEAIEFEMHPLADLIIKMRLWDEKAKENNQPLGDINEYHNKIITHLMHN